MRLEVFSNLFSRNKTCEEEGKKNSREAVINSSPEINVVRDQSTTKWHERTNPEH